MDKEKIRRIRECKSLETSKNPKLSRICNFYDDSSRITADYTPLTRLTRKDSSGMATSSNRLLRH